MSAPNPWPPAPGQPPDGGATPLPPGAVQHRVRRRTALLVAGSLGVLVTAVVVLLRSSEAQGPREVVEAYLAANQRYDWPASWELVCRDEQAEIGSLDRWILTQNGAVLAGGSADGLTVTIGEGHLLEDAARPTWVVGVVLSRAGESRRSEITVVEEDDGLRICGGR